MSHKFNQWEFNNLWMLPFSSMCKLKVKIRLKHKTWNKYFIWHELRRKWLPILPSQRLMFNRTTAQNLARSEARGGFQGFRNPPPLPPLASRNPFLNSCSSSFSDFIPTIVHFVLYLPYEKRIVIAYLFALFGYSNEH